MRRSRIGYVGIVAVIALSGAGSACEVVVDIEDTSEVFYTLRGSATGVIEPVTLMLKYTGGGSENLIITSDGEFRFKAHLDPGNMYLVWLLDDPPCVLDKWRSGVIMEAVPKMTLTCEGLVTDGAAGTVSDRVLASDSW